MTTYVTDASVVIMSLVNESLSKNVDSLFTNLAEDDAL